MAKVFYFLVTFLESIPAVFGIRAPFEEAPYAVERTLARNVEIRGYGPRIAIETKADGGGFQRLFDYIAGANTRDETIAMTTPVEQRGGRMGAPAAGGSSKAAPVMRFFLPRGIAADPPKPKDASVAIVDLPARTVAAIRFSGSLGGANIARHAATLKEALAKAGRETEGEAYVLGYDPPFTIPFLRRNEVAIDLAKASP